MLFFKDSQTDPNAWTAGLDCDTFPSGILGIATAHQDKKPHMPLIYRIVNTRVTARAWLVLPLRCLGSGGYSHSLDIGFCRRFFEYLYHILPARLLGPLQRCQAATTYLLTVSVALQ